MPECSIKFDNNSRDVCYSGQPLSGVIEFANEKKRSITSVTVELKGFAKVK
jgi:hypothetical protein